MIAATATKTPASPASQAKALRLDLLVAIVVACAALALRLVNGGNFDRLAHIPISLFVQSFSDPRLLAGDEFLRVMDGSAPWLMFRVLQLLYALSENAVLALTIAYATSFGVYAASYMLFRRANIRRSLAVAGVLALPFTMETPLGLAGPLIYGPRSFALLAQVVTLWLICSRRYVWSGGVLFVAVLLHQANSLSFAAAMILLVLLWEWTSSDSFRNALRALVWVVGPSIAFAGLFSIWHSFQAGGAPSAMAPLSIGEWRNLCWFEEPDDCTVAFWLFRGPAAWRGYFWLSAALGAIAAATTWRLAGPSGRFAHLLVVVTIGVMLATAALELAAFAVLPDRLVTLVVPIQLRRLFSWTTYASVFVLVSAASQMLDDADRAGRSAALELGIATAIASLMFFPRVRYAIPTVLLIAGWPMLRRGVLSIVRVPNLPGTLVPIAIVLVLGVWLAVNIARPGGLAPFDHEMATFEWASAAPFGAEAQAAALAYPVFGEISHADRLRVRAWLEQASAPGEVLLVDDRIILPRVAFGHPVIATKQEKDGALYSYELAVVWWRHMAAVYPDAEQFRHVLARRWGVLALLDHDCVPGRQECKHVDAWQMRERTAEWFRQLQREFGARYFVGQLPPVSFLAPAFQSGGWAVYRLSDLSESR